MTNETTPVFERSAGKLDALIPRRIAFYDALRQNRSAEEVLGEPTLRVIAQELVETLRRNASIDRTLRENVQAQMRVYVKRILRKYGCPPVLQKAATHTVLERAALLSAQWAVA